MDNIVVTVLAFMAGAFIGWRVADYLHQTVLADILRRCGITPEKLQTIMGDLNKELVELRGQTEPEQESEFPQVEIRIEQHGEQLYAFRKDNDQFLGQGASKEALIERMGEKLSNVRLVVTPEDGAALIGHESFNYDTAKKELSKSNP